MGYHYIINMTPNIYETSIKYATVCQNLKWIEYNHPYRIEYLGASESNVHGLTENLLFTGVSRQVIHAKDFEKVLSDFIPYLEFYNELEYSKCYNTPFLSFSQVKTMELKNYYRKLEGEIDADWFLEVDNLSESEKNNYYNDIKKLYYDYHLEALLYSGLREEYEEYIAKTVPQPPLSETQSQAMEIVDAKAKITGVYYKYAHKWIKGNHIIYGKYHVSVCHSEVIILPYEKKAAGMHTHIADFTFDGCDNLESINIMDNVSYFGEFVFRGCTNLKNVKLNSDMEYIPKNIFVNCTSLQTLEIPQSVKVIGEHAFNGCQALNNAELFSNTCLEKIERGAFTNCISLKNIILPATLLEIEEFAFADSGLESITIPSNVQSIGLGVFKDCKTLKSILFLGGIMEIPILCFSGCIDLESIVLKEGIIKIGGSAFSGCRKLKQIVIPEGVQEIGDDSFEDCTSLIRISFPESVIDIGNCEFNKNTIIYCKENSFIHKTAINEEWNFQLI